MSTTESAHGHLADDGERVQCHECGRWYRALATHLDRTHSMTAAQYREQHGLPRTQPLMSAASRDKLHQAGVWRRDNDPTVMAALAGDGANAQRAAPFAPTPRRQASADRMADSKRQAARDRLDRALSEAGFADLADAVSVAQAMRLGWSGLAEALGVGHTWLQGVGTEAGLALRPPNGVDASRAYVEAARRYAHRHGDLTVPMSYLDGDLQLGRWLSHRRSPARVSRPSWISDELDLIDPDWRSRGRAEGQAIKRGRPAADARTVTAWRRRLDAGETIRQVAAAAGVNESTVRRHVGAVGRPPGARQLDVSVDDVVAAYERTGSAKASAAELGVSHMVARDRLWRAGLLTDPRGLHREPPAE